MLLTGDGNQSQHSHIYSMGYKAMSFVLWLHFLTVLLRQAQMSQLHSTNSNDILIISCVQTKGMTRGLLSVALIDTDIPQCNITKLEGCLQLL